MFLFFFVLSPALGSFFHREPLNLLCSLGNRIQLGACSPHFVECLNGQAQLRKCPIRGEVFIQGVCRPAGRECHELAISFLNEETGRLAFGDQFCGTGMSATIAKSGRPCSRQAILCFGQQIIPITCPQGKTLQSDLSCQVDEQCVGTPSAVFRDYFVYKLCQPSAKFLERVIKRQGQIQRQPTCSTWYISCSPRPAIIRCPSGTLFDEQSRSCRPWQQGDQCMMSGVCIGREYKSTPLGDCQQVYLYCDGPHPKHLYCSPGMIFNGQGCIPSQFANCPICQNGETRPSSSCFEFYQCNANNWQIHSCPQGSAWRQETKSCEASYTCASQTSCRPGEIIQKSCGIALICNGQGFDEVKCPPNSKFEISTGKCHYDPNCNPTNCKEGDVIYTPDCKALTLCKNGQYQPYDCQNARKKRQQDLCQNCGSQFPVQEQPSTPAECENGQLYPHQDDCTAYYECLSQKWELRRCNPGEVWSTQWKKCVLPQYGEGCSIAREKQCQEGERIFNPTQQDCNRIVECQAARWIELTCPSGYFYDVNSKSCQPGTCPSSNGPVITPGIEGPQPPAPPPSDSGFGILCAEGETAADSYDCSKYLICSNGQMTQTICPAGSGFNPSSKTCESGYRCGAECQEGQLLPSAECGHFKVCINGKFWEGRCNKNKKFFNKQCTQEDCHPIYFVPDCVEGSVRPHANADSFHFLACINGRWEERHCSPGTAFNFENLRCEQQAAPLPPPSCYSGETRPIQGSCQDYEECFYGSWKRQRCPYNQVFASRVCVPGNCDQECVEGPEAYRRDPFDCSKYYQCVHGAWMPRPCAPGTVFNERKLVCDWRKDVPECGGTN